MKFYHFIDSLKSIIRVRDNAQLGPTISILLSSKPHGFVEQYDYTSISNKIKYVFFPMKIVSHKIRHLNVICLNLHTHTIERYEPFLHYDLLRVNDTVEKLLYSLMARKQIYFLKYGTSTNSALIDDDKNCGVYCLMYVVKKLKA